MGIEISLAVKNTTEFNGEMGEKDNSHINIEIEKMGYILCKINT